MSDLTERLARCHASPVHDVMREMGYGNCVLPPEIQPLDRGMKLAGEIYTCPAMSTRRSAAMKACCAGRGFCRKCRPARCCCVSPIPTPSP